MPAVVVGAVDAVVVLQVEPLGVAGVAGDLVHALAELRERVGQEVRLDAGVARRARTRRRRWCGRPRRWTSRPAPAAGRSGAAGSCGSPGRRSRRPTRAGAGDPTGRGPARSVTPPSVGAEQRGRLRCPPRPRRARRPGRARAARPARAPRRCPPGTRAAPGRARCQRRPRSSLVATLGPKWELSTPASSRGRGAAGVDADRVDPGHREVRHGQLPGVADPSPAGQEQALRRCR